MTAAEFNTSTTSRIAVVRQSAERWANDLVNVDARNTLLYFKDSKTSTLDVSSADPSTLTTLLNSAKTNISRLLAGTAERQDACNRLRNIKRKLRTLEEEQGIEAGYLVHGLLRVDAPQAKGTKPLKALHAPLLLRRVEVNSRNSAENDFVLQASEDIEVNPVLLYALRREYGLDVDIDKLGEKLATVLAELTDPDDQLDTISRMLIEVGLQHGIEVSMERRSVIGLFSYAKLPMVKDLQQSTALLAQHDLVAALAGVKDAQESLSDLEELGPIPSPDSIAPSDEYLVCDADSSQHEAVNIALSRRSLVIEGPPGTGKSQTIANVIAGAAALGMRTLLVAEKRAAIEAVTSRLAQVQLDGLVFDLHHQKLSKRAVAAKLGENLTRATNEVPSRTVELMDKLVKSREQMIAHDAELHRPRSPWNISIAELQSALIALPLRCQTKHRVHGTNLRTLAGDDLRTIRNDLEHYIELDGLRVRRGESPWSKATIDTENDVRRVLLELTDVTASAWPETTTDMTRLVHQTGLGPASDLAGWQNVIRLLGAVTTTLNTFGPTAYQPDLDVMWLATGTRSLRKAHGSELRWKQRRQLRKQAGAMSGNRLRGPVLHTALSAAVGERDQWRSLSNGSSEPTQVVDLVAITHRFTALRDRLTSIAMCAQLTDLDTRPAAQVERDLSNLQQDRDLVVKLPELRKLASGLESVGLGPLLDDLAAQHVGSEQALETLEWCRLTSLLDELRIQVPHLREFDGEWHTRRARDFTQSDVDHLARTPHQVRYAVARRLREARDQHREQDRTVVKEANKKSRHMPLRKLVHEAPDVLLALHPCWAMSPLVVSQTLPAERLFDLVIFDEASQIEPHEAMTSIMRGDRLVVAGDDQQLPPSRFFDRVMDQSESDDEEDEDLRDYESVLKVLKSFLPCRTLRWHYRSQDERLIAFSNDQFYGNQLVTFPGVAERSPVRLEVVDGVAGPGQGASAPQEVDRVVQLVLEHAEQSPDDSLGVITMGSAHANKIWHALRRARSDRPDLDDFFSDERGLNRRFFVKNLEQVQGDERHSIILSIGYAKRPNGTLNRNFGALNREGGRRRLNVAVTRAQRNLLVVSSFGPADLGTSTNDGVETLRRYLEFAAAGGDLDRVGKATALDLNGFERSVRSALTAAGLHPHPQWGVSGYRIDFAIPHRDQPGKMVLAVETDGHRYHSCASARDRDRLRQEHLERLGWRFHRVWSSAWFKDPERETARIVEAWQHAMDNVVDETPVIARPVVPISSPVPTRGPRPQLPWGETINDYEQYHLVNLCRWLLSDGRQIDRESRLREAQQELGFGRLGKVIRQRLDQAFDTAQRRVDQEDKT